MYERFFGLRERPFSLTPDPDYLYPSRIHVEALSYLRYGLEGHAGFAVVTGEIGSGKTTLLQTALRRLDQQTSVARLMNTLLDAHELIEAVLLDFGLENAASRSKPHMLRELASFLVAERAAGRLAVLVVDEAQNLAMPALEELRMLSNLETEKSKLIQIVLVGQPSLRDTLAKPELRQLKQRISISHHLLGLDETDTAAYIEHRLRRASLGEPIAFPPEVSGLIHDYSGGLPRQINVIADAVLLSAYAEEHRVIDLSIAETTIAELEQANVITPPTGDALARAKAARAARTVSTSDAPMAGAATVKAAAPQTVPSQTTAYQTTATQTAATQTAGSQATAPKTAAPQPAVAAAAAAHAANNRAAEMPRTASQPAPAVQAPAPRGAAPSPAAPAARQRITVPKPAALDDLELRPKKPASATDQSDFMRPGPRETFVPEQRRVGVMGIVASSLAGALVVWLGVSTIDPKVGRHEELPEPLSVSPGRAALAADIVPSSPVGTVSRLLPRSEPTGGASPTPAGVDRSSRTNAARAANNAVAPRPAVPERTRTSADTASPRNRENTPPARTPATTVNDVSNAPSVATNPTAAVAPPVSAAVPQPVQAPVQAPPSRDFSDAQPSAPTRLSEGPAVAPVVQPSAPRSTAPAASSSPAVAAPSPSSAVNAPATAASATSASTRETASTLAAVDERMVRQTLNEYRSAYNRLDAGAARTVWPSVDVRALSRAFESLRSQELAFSACNVTIAGDRANARCGGNARFVPKVGSQSARTESRQWAFDLRKTGDRWTITDVDTR